MADLTPRQARFVEEYLIDLNAAAAYRRAGYKAASNEAASANAARLTAKDSIAGAIEIALRARNEKASIDAQWVLDNLRENVERAMQHKPVRDREGRPTGEYVYEGAVANGALKLLGLHFRLFTERHEHTGKGGGPIEHTDPRAPDWSKLTTEELLAIRDLHARLAARALAGPGDG